MSKLDDAFDAALKRDPKLTQPRRNLDQWFADPRAIETLRSLLQAFLLPGKGSVKVDAMIEELATTNGFTLEMNRDNILNFTSRFTLRPQSDDERNEYLRFIARRRRSKEKQRPSVEHAFRRDEFSLADIYEAALLSLTKEQFTSRLAQIRQKANPSGFFTRAYEEFRAHDEATEKFHRNVIGVPERKTTSFFLYRHTLDADSIYRSYYRFSTHELSGSEEESEGASEDHPNGPHRLLKFLAIGTSRSGPVQSEGFVVSHEDVTYMFGTIGQSRGIHVVAIPKAEYQNEVKTLCGIVLSLDLGRNDSMPLASRVVLVRDDKEYTYAAIQKMVGRNSLAEAKKKWKLNDWTLNALSNQVEMDLEKSIKFKGNRGSAATYEAFLTKIEHDLERALKPHLPPINDVYHTYFLPDRLRGTTALSARIGGGI